VIYIDNDYWNYSGRKPRGYGINYQPLPTATHYQTADDWYNEHDYQWGYGFNQPGVSPILPTTSPTLPPPTAGIFHNVPNLLPGQTGTGPVNQGLLQS
jgi:hypothetical protein